MDPAGAENSEQDIKEVCILIVKEEIEEIKITLTGKMVIRPMRSSFEFIYRTAAGIAWNPKQRELVASRGEGESYVDVYRRIVASVQSEYDIILYASLRTERKSVSQDLSLALSTFQHSGIPTLKSNLAATLGTEGGKFSISLRDFERFPDDSGIRFLIDSRSEHFDIHNFEFYSDCTFFENFLPNIKSIYSTLSGTAKLAQNYEEGLIQITSDGRGHIGVDVETVVQDGTVSRCKIHLDLDQSFLPSFIQSLEEVYLELGYPAFSQS